MWLFDWLKSFDSQRVTINILDDSSSPIVRIRFRFSGNVQGVGFRYEASMVAGKLKLAGWVKNESDGTVTVEAEGQEVRINEFLRVMKSVPRFYLTNIQIESLPVSGAENSFRILY